MPLNPDWVGRTFPASPPYDVTRAKIREFAAALGDDNPAYHDVAAARALGHPDLVAPPTFAIVLSYPIGKRMVADPELGLDYSRVVHGEQTFAYARPIVAGDVLVGTPRVVRIRRAAGNEMLTWSADLATVDGEPVCTTTSTLVSRGTGG